MRGRKRGWGSSGLRDAMSTMGSSRAIRGMGLGLCGVPIALCCWATGAMASICSLVSTRMCDR